MSLDGLLTAAGWLGAAALLAAYVLVSAGRLRPAGAPFHWLNLLGSLGLAANSGYHGAWPSAMLNAVWTGIGCAALALLWRQRFRSRTPDPSRP
jgi:hypothetical protein